MVFAHDTRGALAAATDLVNSAEEPDTLLTVDDVSAFLTRHGYTGRHDATGSELEQLRALRPALRELLTADRDSCVRLVNQHLAENGATPRLVRHDGHDWHVHAVDAEAPLVTRVTVETAVAMVDVIRADEHSRISECDDEHCHALVVDLSRNRSRRYCSTTCGNRNAVAAYRQRRARG